MLNVTKVLNPVVTCGQHSAAKLLFLMSDGHLSNQVAASPPICPTNAQEKLGLMETVGEGRD